MGYQTSEAHEQYRAQPGLSEPDLRPNPRGYLLHGHLTDGPSKVGLSSLFYSQFQLNFTRKIERTKDYVANKTRGLK